MIPFLPHSTYAEWRWVFFDQWSDRTQSATSVTSTTPELRARALEEW